MQRKENITDIRTLLGTANAATAAIRMMLLTGLLGQFQTTQPSREEEEEERGSWAHGLLALGTLSVCGVESNGTLVEKC